MDKLYISRKNNRTRETQKAFTTEYHRERFNKLLEVPCPNCNEPKNCTSFRCKKCTKDNNTHRKFCDECLNEIAPGFTKCLKHVKERTLKRNPEKLHKFTNKICLYCNNKAASNSYLCKSHINTEEHRNKRRSEDLNNKLCTLCKKPQDDEHVICSLCRNHRQDKIKEKNKRKRELGICLKCSEANLGNHIFCESCYFKSVACANGLGARGWKDLQNLYIQQNKKCIYSNEELILGDNASLDHKIPISLGGTSDITNLQWVSKKVNLMKSNLMEDEFISLMIQIITRLENKHNLI